MKLVPAFRRSHSLASTLICDLRKAVGTSRLNDSGAAFRSKSRKRTRGGLCGDFRSAALALLPRALTALLLVMAAGLSPGRAQTTLDKVSFGTNWVAEAEHRRNSTRPWPTAPMKTAPVAWHGCCSSLRQQRVACRLDARYPDGNRRLHSDRQQRLDRSTNSPQYKPSFELNRTVVAEGRGQRFRFRAVDDQAARLRRARRKSGTTISNPSR